MIKGVKAENFTSDNEKLERLSAWYQESQLRDRRTELGRAGE